MLTSENEARRVPVAGQAGSRRFRRLLERSFAGDARDMVLRAYDCAAERFGDDLSDQSRAARLLLSQRADHFVVSGAFLSALRRHGLIGPKEISAHFGVTTAALVEDVFREDILRTDTEGHHESDLGRFWGSISGGLRAVILRIGLRLAELERLAAGEEHGRHSAIARETMELYVPLADRLGMGTFRNRLEDACFHILNPALYRELVHHLAPIRIEEEQCLGLLKYHVGRLLRENGVNGWIQGRVKGLYSLYQKMCRLRCSLQDIMDRIGIRIIVSTEEECYGVLKLLHERFHPIPGTFDDYIGFPKANGYQSLHTCVYPVKDISHKPVEFQIRTAAMHREAMYGVAAHWRYKSTAEARVSDAERLEWLRNLPAQRERASSYAEFIRVLHRQVLGDELYMAASCRPSDIPEGFPEPQTASRSRSQIQRR